MAQVSNELIFETLKSIQTRVVAVDENLGEMRTELHAIRGHMLATQTDVGNLYAAVGKIETRIARIERRLELVDALND